MDSPQGPGSKRPTSPQTEQPGAEAVSSPDDKKSWQHLGVQKSSTGAGLTSTPDDLNETAPAAKIPERAITPAINLFPNDPRILLGNLLQTISQNEPALIEIPAEKLAAYKSKALQESKKSASGFTRALGKCAMIGHLLFEISQMSDPARIAQHEKLAFLYLDKALEDDPERTLAQLKCWTAQQLLATQDKLTPRQKQQLVAELKTAEKKVIPMATWLQGTIYAGIQPGMEAFAEPASVYRSLSAGCIQAKKIHAGDPLRFSVLQCYLKEPELVELPKANDKSDHAICQSFQNLLRTAYDRDCDKAAIAPSPDLIDPMSSTAALLQILFHQCLTPETTIKTSESFYAPIDRLSRYSSPRLRAMGHMLLYASNLTGLNCPKFLMGAARHAEQAGEFYPKFLLRAAWNYLSCLRNEDAERCLNRFITTYPELAQLNAQACDTLQARIRAEQPPELPPLKSGTSRKSRSKQEKAPGHHPQTGVKHKEQDSIKDQEAAPPQPDKATPTTSARKTKRKTSPPAPQWPYRNPDSLLSSQWNRQIKQAVFLARKCKTEGYIDEAMNHLRPCLEMPADTPGIERVYEEMAWCMMDTYACAIGDSVRPSLAQAEDYLLKAMQIKMNAGRHVRHQPDIITPSTNPDILKRQIDETLTRFYQDRDTRDCEELRFGFYCLLSSLGHIHSLKAGFRDGKTDSSTPKYQKLYQLRDQLIAPSSQNT